MLTVKCFESTYASIKNPDRLNFEVAEYRRELAALGGLGAIVRNRFLRRGPSLIGEVGSHCQQDPAMA